MVRILPEIDPSDTNPLQRWQRVKDWNKCLNTVFMDLLDEDSALSMNFPHLHEVFWTRFNEAMDTRDEKPVSLCDEKYPDGHTGKSYRADSEIFQRNYSHNKRQSDNQDEGGTELRSQQLCRQLRERLKIRAAIGAGCKSPFPRCLPWSYS